MGKEIWAKLPTHHQIRTCRCQCNVRKEVVRVKIQNAWSYTANAFHEANIAEIIVIVLIVRIIVIMRLSEQKLYLKYLIKILMPSEPKLLQTKTSKFIWTHRPARVEYLLEQWASLPTIKIHKIKGSSSLSFLWMVMLILMVYLWEINKHLEAIFKIWTV